jgi:U3 small nucleolar RNA-associated protein 12
MRACARRARDRLLSRGRRATHPSFPPAGHKSFHAGAEALTSVAFVASTHYFFCAGRDGALSYYDGDRFLKITAVARAHAGDAWALAASADGTLLASGGGDRALRLWRRTDEQVFVDDEREAELLGAVATAAREAEDEGGGGDAVGPLGAAGEAVPTEADGGAGGPRVVAAPLGGADAGAPTTVLARASGDAARAGERLADALALARAQLAAWREYAEDAAAARRAGGEAEAAALPPPPRAPELLGATPAAHVLRALRGVPPGDVDGVLLGLPFADALDLLRYATLALARGEALEAAARAAAGVLRVHAGRLCASAAAAPLLAAARDALARAAAAARDLAGVNAAGLRFLDRELEGAAAVRLAFGETLSAPAEPPRGAGRGAEAGRGGKRGGKRARVAGALL